MSQREPSTSSILKTLRRKQDKHSALLVRVEKTAARLEKRTLKLQALESRIADLERLAVDPEAARPGGKGDDQATLRHARLIFNPASGRDEENNAERLSHIVRCLRSHRIEAEIGIKTSGKAGRQLAREAVKAGDPLVIVAAGDGTIGDIAAELAGSTTVLGIIPTGTMNNVARSLGVPLEIDDACALIGMGTTRHIDLGRVHTNESPHDEFFLECAGIGLSAIGALAGQAFEKRRWFAIPRAMRQFFETKLGEMRIELDGVVIEAATRIVTVSNAPLMGNNMLAAPGAKMDDGFLDVSIYDGMGDAALVSHFLAASSHNPDQLRIYRARKIRITTEERQLSNSDMKIARAPNMIAIEIVPAALSVIVGNGIGLTIPVESAPKAPTFAADPPSANGTAVVTPDEPAPANA